MRKKIVIILSRFPYPHHKGDQLRAYHQIVFLSSFHDVYLLAISEDKVDHHSLSHMQTHCREVHVFPVKKWQCYVQAMFAFFKQWPVQVGYYHHPSIVKKIDKMLVNIQPDVVYGQLSRTACYVKLFVGRKVIDFQDAFSTNYARTAATKKGIYRWFYIRESKTMQSFEKDMLLWCNATTMISAFDIAQVGNPPHMALIANGVDTHHYAPVNQTQTYDIMFSGNLSYLPNAIAVRFIIEEIVPLLEKQDHAIRIQIVGAANQRQFEKLQHPMVSFSGWVDDIRLAYASTKIFIAPLFTGAGLQNKLLEAMSMEIPCIGTNITNASLLATPNEHVLIANTAQEFVDKIMWLLQHPKAAQDIGKAGRSFVQETYSWDEANTLLMDVLLGNK